LYFRCGEPSLQGKFNHPRPEVISPGRNGLGAVASLLRRRFATGHWKWSSLLDFAAGNGGVGLHHRSCMLAAVGTWDGFTSKTAADLCYARFGPLWDGRWRNCKRL
jgi:hypothetical protein